MPTGGRFTPTGGRFVPQGGRLGYGGGTVLIHGGVSGPSMTSAGWAVGNWSVPAMGATDGGMTVAVGGVFDAESGIDLGESGVS